MHKLLIGTQTSNSEPNSVILMKVKLPLEDTEIDVRKYDDENGELGGFGGVDSKINMHIRINHEGDVNRARYMPQNSNLIGTKSSNNDVYIFDISKHPSVPKDANFHPDIILNGHSEEGYGLSFSTLKSGWLLSGSDDNVIW